MHVTCVTASFFFTLARAQALNSDGQPWKLDFERPELRLRVFYSSVPGEKLYKFKATCELPGMRMEDMWAMLEDNTHRLTWDRNISDITHTRHVRAGGPLLSVLYFHESISELSHSLSHVLSACFDFGYFILLFFCLVSILGAFAGPSRDTHAQGA